MDRGCAVGLNDRYTLRDQGIYDGKRFRRCFQRRVRRRECLHAHRRAKSVAVACESDLGGIALKDRKDVECKVRPSVEATGL